jgi:hypothetical protein
MHNKLCWPALLAVPLLLALVGWPLAEPAQGYEPNVGERYADFTLPDIRTGQPVSLSDFRGKKVLLIQFASW